MENINNKIIGCTNPSSCDGYTISKCVHCTKVLKEWRKKVFKWVIPILTIFLIFGITLIIVLL
ncbi:hypothetical protein ELUMI_v1c01300 [Williamsoniiplasma luminosum]|uniref:Uncharacterized protein n=1 Tax=Williamsoniiplasma luminosum TaxID=214888 RepID=A0A2K8NUL8_9MOLU|nr:hypothetical protein ELUMI_v1c01300 [Williamsoniiplasma luminosum]